MLTVPWWRKPASDEEKTQLSDAAIAGPNRIRRFAKALRAAIDPDSTSMGKGEEADAAAPEDASPAATVADTGKRRCGGRAAQRGRGGWLRPRGRDGIRTDGHRGGA